MSWPAWSDSIYDGLYDDEGDTDCLICGSAVFGPADQLCRGCLRDRSLRNPADGPRQPLRNVDDEEADREADRYEQQLYGHHNHEGAA